MLSRKNYELELKNMRSSHSLKIGSTLKYFANFTGKHLCWSPGH